MPVASATAAPPEEPPQVSALFHGLRVMPNTSLKVFAPAPNSGVLVLPSTIPPAASIRSTCQSEESGTSSAKIGEPMVVRTPSTSTRSLISTGRPASETRRRGTSHDPPGMVARPLGAQRRHGVDQRIDRGDPRQRGVDQLERRDLAGVQATGGFPRRQIDQRAHAST